MHMQLVRFSSRCLILGMLIFLVLPLDVLGQKLTGGSMVRVHREGAEPQRGEFLRMTADSIWFRVETERVGILLDDVSRLDVHSRMSRGRSALRWAGRAFVVGAGVGAISCLVQTEDCKSYPDEPRLESVMGSALFLGAGLASFGAIGGALFPGNRWRQVGPPFETRLTVSPHVFQVKVSVAL